MNHFGVYSKLQFPLTALARFAFGHNKHLKSIAASYWKLKSSSHLSSFPSLAHIKGAGGGQRIISSFRVGSDSATAGRDVRVSTSSPLATSGIMHGSPVSDNSSQHSDSGILNDGATNGVLNHSSPKLLDSALYSQSVSAMFTLANDPSPRVAKLGRRILSIIGIEQVVAKPMKSSGLGRHSEPTANPHSIAGLARSSSWFDMSG